MGATVAKLFTLARPSMGQFELSVRGGYMLTPLAIGTTLAGGFSITPEGLGMTPDQIQDCGWFCR